MGDEPARWTDDEIDREDDPTERRMRALELEVEALRDYRLAAKDQIVVLKSVETRLRQALAEYAKPKHWEKVSPDSSHQRICVIQRGDGWRHAVDSLDEIYPEGWS